MDFILPRAYAATHDVTVVNSPSTSMTMDSANFAEPTLEPSMLDFGYLTLTQLYDNNLEVCGASGTDHCTTALIRIYTQGTAGEGLYNSDVGYGLPIYANRWLEQMLNVGLDAGNAANVHLVSIPADKHAFSLSDLDSPNYYFHIDFTNAGAGTFSTTVVVEYGLTSDF